MKEQIFTNNSEELDKGDIHGKETEGSFYNQQLQKLGMRSLNWSYNCY